MNKLQVEQQADITLQIAEDDGDYQAALRLAKCSKPYLRELANALQLDVKANKFYLAKAIVRAMQRVNWS